MEGGGNKESKMEGGGNKESGSSSFVNDLFGPKENPSAVIYDAIFRPGRGESLNSPELEKNGSASQPWKAKNGVADQNGVGVGQGTTNKYNQEENVHQSFHYQYSSSIYYGGPDLYIPPKTAPSPYFTTFNKDGTDDIYHSRGNWWLGSLYY